MGSSRDSVHPKRVVPGAVVEAERRLSVRAKADVVVCGGGPAGIGAALAAGREEASVLLIERWAMLGGMWTAGLVNPFFQSQNQGFLVDELIRRLEDAGAWRRWRTSYTFTPAVLRRVVEEMMADAGVDLLYYALVADTIVDESGVCGVVVESKAGREAVLGQVVIDATGDGDVAARAGCAYEMGRESDGLVQPMTLMFEVRGAAHFDHQQSALPLWDAMAQAIDEHGLDAEMPVPRANAAPWIITLPGGVTSAVQTTHVYRLNPLDPGDLTQGTMSARRQVTAVVDVLRHVPGFENVELVTDASSLGIRESRRVRGLYRMEQDDLREGRRFDDAVATCSFGVDIHEPAPGSGVPRGDGIKAKPYEIPYRCLVPSDVDGLLVTGRCISGSHEAHASYRVTGVCMGTGQAAGVAAAWAVRDGIRPRDVDGVALRAALAERGAKFLGDDRRRPGL